jgi:Holliday junction DNA helicase RuvB
MNFVGLKSILYELKLIASKTSTFPHSLFKGPRGCGKTVLSREIGRITHQRFIELNAPALDKKRLYVVLLNTKPNDIIFIDEIHRLTPVVEEILYQPMESKMLTIPCGGRLMTVPFVPFTLIGATTRPALITKPLLSRFKITIDIPPYTTRDLARIIKGKYQMTNREALNIARHTLVPREALNLAERALALDMGVATGLTFLNFKDGLSADERVYLKQLAQGDSHSIQSIASGMQLELDSITFLEDRLFKLGYIEVTSKGRQLTYLGLAKARSL